VQEFEDWHAIISDQLGYPFASVDNMENIVGEPYTTRYTIPVVVSDDDVRAPVDDSLSDGLIPSESPFPITDPGYSPTFNGSS
jgi:hypothetical protein